VPARSCPEQCPGQGARTGAGPLSRRPVRPAIGFFVPDFGQPRACGAAVAACEYGQQRARYAGLRRGDSWPKWHWPGIRQARNGRGSGEGSPDMTSRRDRQLTPDERDGEADNRDETACSRDRTAQARGQESAARDVTAGARDEAAVLRDRMWTVSRRDHAAGEIGPSDIAGDAAASADGDAGQLAWWRGEAAAARQETADQRRILAEERDDVRILLDQVRQDRRAAAADRGSAARDRDAATGDRDAASQDREATFADRQQAAVERAEEPSLGAEA
jgi:hypothetical protein